jgi:two-component system, OmpR family, response regulator
MQEIHGLLEMKVFLVEDSAAIRERLVEMINEIENVEVVGEADTYDSAVRGILDTRPDVVVLDISLASGSGIEVLAQVRETLPGLRGIMLTNYDTPQHARASAAAGAEHFLDKSADFERITEILQQMKGARSVR